MKQDKWIEQLHDKLAEHEIAAPEGLWDKIETTLEKQSASPQQTSGKSRFATFFSLSGGKPRRWVVAASLAALLVGGGYLTVPLLSPKQEESANEQQLAQSSIPLSPQREVSNEAATSHPFKEQDGHLLGRDEEEPIRNVAVPTSARPYELGEAVVPQNGENTVFPSGTGLPETLPVPTEADAPTQLAEAAGTKETSAEHYDRIEDIKRKQEVSRRSLHLSLYAMNSLGSQSNSNGVLMADHLARQFNDIYEQSDAVLARGIQPIYLSGFEERQYHHYPVSFGLTLSYPLSARLSLSTGIVYTRLTSDFTQIMRSQQIQQQQTLHYVGVPVGVNYQVWQYKRFRTYLSIWGKADWNVDTRMETEGVVQESPRDHVQWSLGGSLGAQLDLMPQVGLYAEPGLGWYPDNGSRVQNYFKDKPLNLNLQVGLRLNLGQF